MLDRQRQTIDSLSSPHRILLATLGNSYNRYWLLTGQTYGHRGKIQHTWGEPHHTLQTDIRSEGII